MLEVCYLSIRSIRPDSLTDDLPLGKLKKKMYVHACCVWCQNRIVFLQSPSVLCLRLSHRDQKVYQARRGQRFDLQLFSWDESYSLSIYIVSEYKRV